MENIFRIKHIMKMHSVLIAEKPFPSNIILPKLICFLEYFLFHVIPIHWQILKTNNNLEKSLTLPAAF